MSASMALGLKLQGALPKKSSRAVKLTEQSDEELLARVQHRNVRALEVLFDRYASRALGLAFRVVQDRDLAEQVVQDTFWRVWRNASQFEPKRGRFSTWLFVIVRNLSIDQLRRRRSDVSLDEPEQAESIEGQLAGADVDDTVTRRLDGERVRAALKSLPEAQRRVIELVYFEGFSHREVAKELGTPLGTIHTRARLGLEKLRQVLGMA